MKKNFSLLALILSTAMVALFFLAPTKYVVPVLMYHSIAPEYFEPLNNVRPESFARQMEFIKQRGYKVISTAELVQLIRSGERPDMNSVVITFDDGIDNNYSAAYPILKKYGIKATMFIPSAKVGLPGRMTWDQLKEMSENGITIGSHTRTEAYVPMAHGQVLIDEIIGSKKELEQNLGRPVELFAYPVGGFTDEIKTLAKQAGYQAAFTTNRGGDRFNQDLFELKRVRVKDSDTKIVLWAKMSGFYNFFRTLRNPH